MRRLSALVLLTLFVESPGCGWLFHKPRPDADKPLEQRPWRVRCAWVVEGAGQPGEPPGPQATGTVWAADAENRRLIVNGGLEDGFLRVDSIDAASETDERDVVSIPLSAATVGDLCTATVRRLKPDVPAEVYGIAAVREGGGAEVTMAFPFDPNGNLLTRVVIFGDSLSDPGNLKQRLKIFPASPYWIGRFSNGPNWADFLTRSTGLAVRNDAFGGAVAIKHEDVPATSVIGAIEQGAQVFLTGSVDRYVNDYLARDLPHGVVERPWDTLFVIWAGANDYLSKEPFTGDIGTLLDTPRGEGGYERIVDETVQAIADQVARLYAAGARQFLVLGLPDLGRTPIVLHNTSYQPRGVTTEDGRRRQLSAKLSVLTALHNSRLRKAVESQARDLPGARIVMVVPEHSLELVIEKRAPGGGRGRYDLGFALTALERTVPGRPRPLRLQERCYEGGYLGTSDPAKVCSDASRALFWDAVHPSSYSHCWIAWVIETNLATNGLLTRAPTAEEQKRFCEGATP